MQEQKKRITLITLITAAFCLVIFIFAIYPAGFLNKGKNPVHSLTPAQSNSRPALSDIKEKNIKAKISYGDYIKNKKNIGFQPTIDFCRSILYRIENEYVDEVDPATLFISVKSEVKNLLGEAKIDSAAINDLPLTKDIFDKIISLYSDKISGDVLIFACINGLVNGLNDRHCSFLTPQQYRRFVRQTKQNQYSGIGLKISKEDSKLPAKVIEVFQPSPAYAAGIMQDDEILSINSKSLIGLDLKDSSVLLTGKENSMVSLDIKRKTKKLAFTVKRKKIIIKTVHHKLLDNHIGYIKIDSFKEELDGEFKTSLEMLEKDRIKALIIDLRNNPGGLVRSAQQLCGNFLPEGTVISVFRHKGKSSREITAFGRRTIFIPAAILVNEHSASSSEITAGALKDYKSAVIIGKKTKGKGSVQRTTPLENGTALKLTIEKITTPSGYSIDRYGIIPDILVEDKKEDNKKDLFIEKAEEYLKKEIESHI